MEKISFLREPNKRHAVPQRCQISFVYDDGSLTVFNRSEYDDGGEEFKLTSEEVELLLKFLAQKIEEKASDKAPSTDIPENSEQ